MSERVAQHATFTLERDYSAAPGRVFAAWADPVAKSRWFAGEGTTHELDFRVGGTETVLRRDSGAPELRFVAEYRDIVPQVRIVFTSSLFAEGELATVALTTVRFDAAGGGTRLVLTEQGTFLDGREAVDWREKGTGDWLDALAVELLRPASA
ncbi:SRPBCC family protein [Actinophytocola sp.]|uniref:SRPBCC family protein n=1 Tax=Actinophytocola sp. TaxID=1872138 RepID=UPI002D801E0F|nr:SRPBCC family protein [Actinophytocola sp.]HET9143235.1 SRPBCC family protein [Actinophytocola sp.]HEU5107635.1 SRPBCC family protein [Micromonosporaceae bacterium]